MAKTEILMMLGGLALFLYGMQMMSSGLEAAAGAKMKTILEKLTSNRIKGVLAGAGITAVIQSSSATTVMVVGFVSAGLITLNQAVWVIMGANIGTTIWYYWPSSGCIRTFWTEYRDMYYSGSCFNWNQNKCKAYNYHSSNV